jgi:fatty-acyl-CoA synthase
MDETDLIAKLDLSSLKICVAVGEPCPPALISKFHSVFQAQFLTGYGLTECLPGIIHAKHDIDAGRIPTLSCGKLFFGEAKLVDESGEENPRRGCLWIRNPTVSRCYEDEKLNAAMIEDGWYKTKDVFERDDGGHFYHKHRADDMFICNGKNIYPAEIESVLLAYPGIREACAVPIVIDDEVCPGALVTAADNTSEVEIYRYMGANAPSHLMPRRIRIVEELPRLGPGKIDRRSSVNLLQGSPPESARRNA